jgi:hypothetical protein
MAEHHPEPLKVGGDEVRRALAMQGVVVLEADADEIARGLAAYFKESARAAELRFNGMFDAQVAQTYVAEWT